jgi:hypothetical protein
MYSESKKFIFIPTRKTAGMSITQALLPYVKPEHVDLYNLGTSSNGSKYGIWPKKFLADFSPNPITRENFVFSIVRNPWDKMVSNYHYSRKGYDIWGRILSFPTFCKMVDSAPMPENWEHHTRWSTTKYITDYNGDVVADFVMKFENLENDFKTVISRIGLPDIQLPHINQSRNDREYVSYYTEEESEVIQKYYGDDIDAYKYSYEY